MAISNTKVVPARLPNAVVEQIDQLTSATGMNRNQVVKAALNQYLESALKDKTPTSVS